MRQRHMLYIFVLAGGATFAACSNDEVPSESSSSVSTGSSSSTGGASSSGTAASTSSGMSDPGCWCNGRVVDGCGGGCYDEFCLDNTDCEAEEFCDALPDECPSDMLPDGNAVCTARPTACEDVDDPVCGCDGNTYFNACDARSQGVAVEQSGPCP